MTNPDLKQAVWQVLSEYAKRDEAGGSVHSDLVLRKFPQVNEIELINAIGELVEDGWITVKAATVDAQGNPTAYHVRVRGAEERPEGAQPPRGGIASSSVGLSGTPSTPPRPTPPEQPPPEDERAVDRAGRVDVGFGGPEVPPAQPPPKPPPEPDTRERVAVTVGADPKEIRAAMQEEADQNFADEVASFFAELQAAEARDEEAKKRLIDELAMLVALFDTGDAATFTTPISKLAALKKRVQTVAPHLVGDFILLMQTGLRAWLGRM